MAYLLRPPLLSATDPVVRSLLAIEREAHSLLTHAEWGDVDVLRRLEAAHLIETLGFNGFDGCEAWLTDAGWQLISVDTPLASASASP
jgi:hypothetical protein